MDKVRLSKKAIYRVSFVSHNKVYEVYARKITTSELFGFVEIEELVFGETSQVLVDPSEEKLKLEFADVKRSFIPMHTVLRIDEVLKEGIGKVTAISGKDSNVSHFPTNVYTPPTSPKDK